MIWPLLGIDSGYICAFQFWNGLGCGALCACKCSGVLVCVCANEIVPLGSHRDLYLFVFIQILVSFTFYRSRATVVMVIQIPANTTKYSNHNYILICYPKFLKKIDYLQNLMCIFIYCWHLPIFLYLALITWNPNCTAHLQLQQVTWIQSCPWVVVISGHGYINLNINNYKSTLTYWFSHGRKGWG